MQLVSAEWIDERGALHDARVIDVRFKESILEIELDDEWASCRGLTWPEGQEAPGTLVVKGFFAAEDEVAALTGGWISYLELRDDQLDLVFCDRAPLTRRVGSVWWRSANRVQTL